MGVLHFFAPARKEKYYSLSETQGMLTVLMNFVTVWDEKKHAVLSPFFKPKAFL